MLRVLYFSIVAQSEIASGGAISSRTTIRRLKEDDNIDLAVVIAGTEICAHTYGVVSDGYRDR